MSTRARIKINSAAGSRTDIVLGTTVNLANDGLGGESTYLWELLDIPEGSTAVLSSSSIAAPNFVADIEGTYLIKLSVNRLLSDADTDTVVAGVLRYKDSIRVPAAGETTEESTLRGWAKDVNRALNKLGEVSSDPTSVLGIAFATLGRGTVAVMDTSTTIRTGTAQEERVPYFKVAVATSATFMDRPLYVVERTPSGGTSASPSNPVYARMYGVVGPIILGGGTAGDPVYVTDTGAMSTSPGTHIRRVGNIVYVDSTNYWVHFNGSLGHHEGDLSFYDSPTITSSNGPITITAASNLFLEGTNGAHGISITNKVAFTGGSMILANVADPVSDEDAVNNRYLQQSGSSVLLFGNASTPSSAGMAYIDPGWGNRTAPTSNQVPGVPCPYEAVLSDIEIVASTGPVGDDVTFEVRINAATTGIEAKLTAGTTSASDHTHSFSVAVGELITLTATTGAGISSGAVRVVAALTLRRVYSP